MSFRRYCMIILNPLKKTMTPNTRKNTASTGLSVSRKESNVSLNAEIMQKEQQVLNVQILNVGMSFSVLFLAKAGIFTQAVTRKGFRSLQNTSQEICYSSFPTASLFLLSPSSCGYISNMTGTFSLTFPRSYSLL